VWLEFECTDVEGTNYVSANVRVQRASFANLGGTSWQWLDGGWVRQSIESALRQSAYETVELLFTPVRGGCTAGQRSYATECVPEPSALILLGVGATTLLILRRRS